MSISQKITWKSLPIETSNVFVATFNTPPGRYGFTQNQANRDQLVIPINNRYVYLIDRLSYSASVAEGTYLRSLAVNPTLRLKLRNTPQPLYPYPLPAINYKDGLEFNFWFQTKKKNDELLITMEGELNQVAETVGVSEIVAQVSIIIYQEENLDKITQMRTETGPRIGRFFNG